MARLSYQARKKLSASTFALPGAKTKKNPAGRGGYPVPDAAHARNALARVSQHGSSAEKAAVRAKVRAKFPGIKVTKAQRGFAGTVRRPRLFLAGEGHRPERVHIAPMTGANRMPAMGGVMGTMLRKARLGQA